MSTRVWGRAEGCGPFRPPRSSVLPSESQSSPILPVRQGGLFAHSSCLFFSGPPGLAPGLTGVWLPFPIQGVNQCFTKLSLTSPPPQQELLCYWNCCGHFLGTVNSSNRDTQWEVWTNSVSVCSSWAARRGEYFLTLKRYWVCPASRR